MRKSILMLSAFAVAAIMPAAPALAEGTIVIGDGTCSGFVPTADGQFGFPLSGGEIHVVTHGGTTQLTCHLDIPAGHEPSKGVRAYNVPCQTPLGPTTDTRMSASPGGRASGVLRIRKS